MANHQRTRVYSETGTFLGTLPAKKRDASRFHILRVKALGGFHTMVLEWRYEVALQEDVLIVEAIDIDLLARVRTFKPA